MWSWHLASAKDKNDFQAKKQKLETSLQTKLILIVYFNVEKNDKRFQAILTKTPVFV